MWHKSWNIYCLEHWSEYVSVKVKMTTKETNKANILTLLENILWFWKLFLTYCILSFFFTRLEMCVNKSNVFFSFFLVWSRWSQKGIVIKCCYVRNFYRVILYISSLFYGKELSRTWSLSLYIESSVYFESYFNWLSVMVADSLK